MDRVLKEFTEHPVVVDIVVKGVTNKKAKYEAKSVEWDDGTRSELVLLPKKQNNSKSLAPVIIEFQENVDDAYIKKLIGKGLQASTKYDIAPYFLIICMGKLDSALNVKKPRSTPCFELSCTTWAQKCLIMNRNSAYDHVQGVDTGDTLGYYHNRVCELNPFIAYAIFITGLTEDVLEKSEDEIDPTLDVLFTILQKVRRKLFGDEVVDKAPPSSVENPINDFYKVFEESLYTLLSSYCFDEGGEEYIAEYATRKPQKMVSAKERRRIIEEYENDMEQDDDW